MDINQMTLTELKALAYDVSLTLQTAQNNLKVINQQIANKLKETTMDEETVVTEEVTEEVAVEETAPVAEETAVEEVAATEESAE